MRLVASMAGMAIVLASGCTEARDAPAVVQGAGADKPDRLRRPPVTEQSPDCEICEPDEQGACVAEYRTGCDGHEGLCALVVSCAPACCKRAIAEAARSIAIIRPGAEIFGTTAHDREPVGRLQTEGPGILVRRTSRGGGALVSVDTVGPIPEVCTSVVRELESFEVTLGVKESDLLPAPADCATSIVEKRSKVDSPVGNADGADRYLEPWNTLSWNDADQSYAGRSIGPSAISARGELPMRANGLCCFPLPSTAGPGICALCSSIVDAPRGDPP